jgi:hypothetical protein
MRGCETLHNHAIATVAAVGIGVVKRAHRLTSLKASLKSHCQLLHPFGCHGRDTAPLPAV